MSIEETVDRAQKQQAGGVVNPLVVLRMAEHQHRKARGAKPDCIKLSPSFYHDFMTAYKNMKDLLKRGKHPEDADQIDMERPHLLGVPIVCDPAMTENDIRFHVI